MKTLPEKIRSAIICDYGEPAMYKMLEKLGHKLGVAALEASECFAKCLEAIATEIEENYTPSFCGVDADGVPIKYGDELFVISKIDAAACDIDTSVKVIVINCSPDTYFPIGIKYTSKSGTKVFGYAKGKALSRELDTLERLKQDIIRYAAREDMKVLQFSNRLDKLIKAANHEG